MFVCFNSESLDNSYSHHECIIAHNHKQPFASVRCLQWRKYSWCEGSYLSCESDLEPSVPGQLAARRPGDIYRLVLSICLAPGTRSDGMDALRRGMGYCFMSKPQFTATNMKGLGFQMCGWGFKKPMKVKKRIMLRSETLVIVWICLYDSRFPRRWMLIHVLYPSWFMAQCCSKRWKDAFRCTTV